MILNTKNQPQKIFFEFYFNTVKIFFFEFIISYDQKRMTLKNIVTSSKIRINLPETIYDQVIFTSFILALIRTILG